MESALKMIKRYFENKDEARLKQYLNNCKVPREDLQESIEQFEDFDLLDFFLDCCKAGAQVQAAPEPETAGVDVVERSEAERKEDFKKELERIEQFKAQLWWGTPEYYFRHFDLQYGGKFPAINSQKDMDELVLNFLKVFRSLRYNGEQYYVIKKMEYDSYGKPLCLTFDIMKQTAFNSTYSKFKYSYWKTVGRDAKGEKDPLFATPILNLFTGYQTKLLEQYDMKKVQPFLDLMLEIWADNDLRLGRNLFDGGCPGPDHPQEFGWLVSRCRIL